MPTDPETLRELWAYFLVAAVVVGGYLWYLTQRRKR